MRKMETTPKEIKLREKDLLQLDGDLYIFKEGNGMCQDGAITIMQKDFSGNFHEIRFHKSDKTKIINALKGKIPTMTEKNSEEFNDNIKKLKEDW